MLFLPNLVFCSEIHLPELSAFTRYNIIVDQKTAQYLIKLNHQFYQSFAHSFAETRMRIQPGVRMIIDDLPSKVNILDLGCGNGELACKLIKRNHSGRYIGVDSTQELLSIATDSVDACTAPESALNVTFIEADISTSDWMDMIPDPPFKMIFAFAVIHHLPGSGIRNELLKKIRHLLLPDGLFFHSEWQFLNSERLRKRIIPWEKVDLSPEDVDEGDYLLDWRRGGEGLRYVHHFNESELQTLAENNGFQVRETFYSDGAEGNLGLYQSWQLM